MHKFERPLTARCVLALADASARNASFFDVLPVWLYERKIVVVPWPSPLFCDNWLFCWKNNILFVWYKSYISDFIAKTSSCLQTRHNNKNLPRYFFAINLLLALSSNGIYLFFNPTTRRTSRISLGEVSQGNAKSYLIRDIISLVTNQILFNRGHGIFK